MTIYRDRERLVGSFSIALYHWASFRIGIPEQALPLVEQVVRIPLDAVSLFPIPGCLPLIAQHFQRGFDPAHAINVIRHYTPDCF